MRADSLFLLALATMAATAPLQHPDPSGFINPTFHPSTGGKSTCVSGSIAVDASGTNIHFDMPIPVNQTVVTEAVLQAIVSNSPYPANIISGTANVSGTYNIGATLCLPRSGSTPKRVQVASHGVLFGRNYWDFAPNGYSYVDTATASGDAVFFYDRLGVGSSDHPDPINVVQAGLQVGILHGLADMLRSGRIGGCAFDSLVGVGHSFGSVVTSAVTGSYPSDFDAVVLTGMTLNLTGVPIFWEANTLVIASDNQASRFGHLDNGYLVGESAVGAQQTCFRFPQFSDAILQQHERTKQTVTLGEIFSAAGIVAPAEMFQGAVIVVDGENDLLFCYGNCTYPSDLADTVSALYPAVKKGKGGFETMIVPGTGHGVNLHYTAEKAFEWIQSALND